jgi:hypothetical protein
LEEIESQGGQHFDPHIVDIFLKKVCGSHCG